MTNGDKLKEIFPYLESDDTDLVKALNIDNLKGWWNTEYQEPTTKNDLGVDWESYKDVDGNSLDDLILEVLQNNFDCGNTYGYKVADEIIGLLPSVTPIRSKGHWKSTINGKPICSECGFISESLDGYFVSNYCPNCGCRMVEPQESEG